MCHCARSLAGKSPQEAWLGMGPVAGEQSGNRVSVNYVPEARDLGDVSLVTTLRH